MRSAGVVLPATQGHSRDDAGSDCWYCPFVALGPRSLLRPRGCEQQRTLCMAGLKSAFQYLQIRSQFLCVLVALFLVLFYGLIDDGCSLDRNARIHRANGWRLSAENG